MNDLKIKLGNIESYDFDTTKYRENLRRDLLNRYDAIYGESMNNPKKRDFSLFKRFVPVMASIALVAFIGFEFFTRPLSAYAFLKQVEEMNFSDGNGLSFKFSYALADVKFEVDVIKANSGDAYVKVVSSGKEQGEVLLKNGSIFSQGVEGIEKKDLLEKSVNSLILANYSDPRADLKSLMKKDDVKIELLEDDPSKLVKISYQELNDGTLETVEYKFLGFKPLERTVYNEDQELKLVVYNEVDIFNESLDTVFDSKTAVEVASISESSNAIDSKIDVLVDEFKNLPESEKIVFLDVFTPYLAESSSLAEEVAPAIATLDVLPDVQVLKRDEFVSELLNNEVILVEEVKSPNEPVSSVLAVPAIITTIPAIVPPVPVLKRELDSLDIDASGIQTSEPSIVEEESLQPVLIEEEKQSSESEGDLKTETVIDEGVEIQDKEPIDYGEIRKQKEIESYDAVVDRKERRLESETEKYIEYFPSAE